ncbi:MAG: hypothetical protein ABUS79_03560 [Pseudomonadota bacterium]
MFARKSDAKPEVDFEGTMGAAHVHASAPVSGPPYGIEDAIQLMRSLPTDQNMDLVVRVVRVTLGSLDVRFEDIIADATRKQKTIQETIASLHGQVAELEKQLDARRRDIAAHEADLKETTGVKERLYLAEKAAAGQRIPTPAPAQGHAPTVRASSLPRPAPRDESGEFPEILSEVDLDDLTAAPTKRPGR